MSTISLRTCAVHASLQGRFWARCAKASVDAARLFGRLRDIALPSQCALCGNLSHRVLCAGCDEQYWNQARTRCSFVHCPCRYLPGPAKTAPALSHAASVHHRAAAFRCDDRARRLSRATRYTRARAEVSRAAGGRREFARQLQAAFEDSNVAAPDVVAPVPLSRKRLRTRGYNQAWSIGKPLGTPAGLRSRCNADRAYPAIPRRKRSSISIRAATTSAMRVQSVARRPRQARRR